VFAGVSEVWGGGVAFVDPQRSPEAETPGLAHLMTVEQLADLAIQECGGEAPGEDISMLPGPGQCLRVGSGRYDLLLGADHLGGVAAVILTSSDIPPQNEPSPTYLQLIREGRVGANARGGG
jgi:hypothetical protein